MKLEPLPGAPGYMVDTDNMVAYNYKTGIMRPVKTKTKYKKCGITVNGLHFITTIYRMAYCVQRGIDITKLPKGVCIGMKAGNITVMSRAEVQEKAMKTYRAKRENLEKFQRNYQLVDKFYKGDTKPLLEYVQKAEKEVTNYYINTRGLGKVRAEIVVGNAVNKLLDRFRNGEPVLQIKTFLYRLAQGENENYARRVQEFMETLYGNMI